MFNLEKLSSTLQQGVSALQDLGAQVANASQVYIEPLQERVQKVRIASFKKKRYPTIDRDIAYLEEMARQRYNCPAPGKRPSGRRPSGSPPPPPPAVRGKSFDVSTRGVLTGGGGDGLAVPEEGPRRYSSPANPGSSIGAGSNGNGVGGTGGGTSGPSTGSNGVPSANSDGPAVAPRPVPGPIKGKNGKPARQPPVITINRTTINWNEAPTTSATTTTSSGPPRSRVWRGRIRGWWQRFQRYVRAYLDEDEEETGPGNDNRARKDGSDGPPKWVY